MCGTNVPGLQRKIVGLINDNIAGFIFTIPGDGLRPRGRGTVLEKRSDHVAVRAEDGYRDFHGLVQIKMERC